MSGVSVSSYGSGPGSVTADGLRPNAGEDDHILNEPHSIQLGVFGVLYTVSKEKELTSVKFAFFRLFLDFLQLWLLVVNPTYGWTINAKHRGWQIVSFIQLNEFLSARGYTFFLVMFYIFVGLLGVNLALSIWVANAFSNNRFEYVWPIQFLRWFGLIFYQVLDIATLTLLLVALDCNYFGVREAVQFYNQEFPSVMCWTMPHIIHVTVSVTSIVVFFVMATCMVLSEMELNPLTRNYMAIYHTSNEGWGFAIKTIVTIASVMLPGSTKVLSLVYFVFFTVLFYTNVKWVPFIYGTLNHVRCASYGTVVYSSVLLMVLAFGPESHDFRKEVTLALWVGMGPAALVGALVCHLRLRYINVYVVERFRDAEPGTNSKYIHRFKNTREVEIAARCCRHWIDEDTLEPDAVALSEQIIKAGMMQLPHDPKMIILYSSFLIDVQGSYQSGYTQLQTAKKQPLDLLERFAIFSREQEHTQKANSANSGDAAVDLVSYVEFQRNHRLVVHVHREALLAIRGFWALLLRSHVNFNALSKALHRIEVTVKAAERAYRGVLVRHGSSSRIVRLYGKFLETVKFDPWAAAKWYAEADKLEEAAEHSKEAMQLGGIETILPQSAAGDRGLAAIGGIAFICINAQGQIQVASPEAHSMLGYGKNELKGRDLGIIMPAPISERHTAYVRQYIQTGVSTMLGKHLEVMVITKSRQVFPVRMHVSKISGLNEDSVFLGMLEPLPPSPDDARLWVLGTGVIVAADAEACDWLGYDASDLAGRQLEEMMVEKDAVHEAIKVWNRSQNGGAPPRANGGSTHAQRQRRNSLSVADGILNAAMNLPSPSPFTISGGTADSNMAPAAERSRNVGMSWLRRASFIEPAVALMSPMFHGAQQQQAGGGAGVEAVPAAASPPPMVMARAAWRHKYLEALEFDMYIQPGSIGSIKIHSVIIRRCATRTSYGARLSRSVPDPHYRDMLLVADHQGHVLHATAALAQALGRTVEQIRAGGLGLLIPEPTSVLHGPWLQALSNPLSYGPLSDPQAKIPPYSCRSGRAVSLVSHSESQGVGTKQFQVSVSQRLAEGGGSRIHVVSLTTRTLDEALSERRMKLTLDLRGTIVEADGATPADLYGADPRSLIGSSISQLVDLFDQEAFYEEAFDPEACDFGAAQQSTGRDVMEIAADLFQAAFARHLTRVLLQLAKRSTETPECSWRVGVRLPPDEAALAELQALAAVGALGPEELELAAQLTGARTVPAVMKLRLVRRRPPPAAQQTGARAGAPQLPGQSGVQLYASRDEECVLPPQGGSGEVGSTHASRGLYRNANTEYSAGYGSGAATGSSPTAAGAPGRALLRRGESLRTSTDAPLRGTTGQPSYQSYQYVDTGGFGSAINTPFLAPSPLQPQPRGTPAAGAATATGGDVRLVLPTAANHGTAHQPACVNAGGAAGLQLPREAAEMFLPVQLDPVGGGDVIMEASLNTGHQVSGLGQQGVWAPVAKAPMPGAPSAAAEVDRVTGNGVSRRHSNTAWRGIIGLGAVAEAVELSNGAGGGDTAACAPLEKEDEAVLEQLVRSAEEAALSSEGSADRTLVGLSRSKGSVASASSSSGPSTTQPFAPPLSLSGVAGASVLAAAVAAAVERGPPTAQLSAGSTPRASHGDTANHMMPRTSFNSQGSRGAVRGPPTPSSDSRLSRAVTPQHLLQQQALSQAPSAAAAAAAATAAVPSRQPPPAQKDSRSAVAAPAHAAVTVAGGIVSPVSLRLLRNVGSSSLGAGVATAAATAGFPTPAALMESEQVAAAEPSAPGLVLEVELWRADLLSGVLEVDDKGKVLRADPVCPLGQAGLVLGAPPAAVVGAQVSELMSLPGGSNGVLTLLEADTPGAGGGDALRGALKKRGTRNRLGGTSVVTMRHQSDGCAMDVQVTAVQRAGPYGSAYLVVRPSAPSCVQPGFTRWLYNNDVSGLMSVQRRATVQGVVQSGTSNAGPPTGAPKMGGTMSRVMSLDQVFLANASVGGTGCPASPSRLGTLLRGSMSVPCPDKVPDSAMLLSVPEAGSMPRSTATALAPPPVQPIEGPPVSSALRIAALRGSFVAGNSNGASAPSRLSVKTSAGQGVAALSSPLEDIVEAPPGLVRHDGGGGTAAAAPLSSFGSGRKGVASDGSGDAHSGSCNGGLEQDILVSNVSLDTAFGRGGGTPSGAASAPRLGGPAASGSGMVTAGSGMVPSGMVPSGSGMVPSSLRAAAGGTPRQSATLMAPAGADTAREPSRRGRLPESKAGMVQSWVLSDGQEHTPDLRLTTKAGSPMSITDVAAARANNIAPGGVPSPCGDRPDSGSDNGDDCMSGLAADGDGRSSNDSGDDMMMPDGGGGGDNSGGGKAARNGSVDAMNESGGRDGTEDVESEAGALVANYSTGKRFRRLYKILTTPLALQPVHRLRLRTFLVVGLLLAVHTATFALLLVKLIAQKASVTDLHSVANAARNVHEVAICGRTLESLYSNSSYVPGLPVFGDPVEEALQSVYSDMEGAAESMKTLHHGVYLGFRKLRRISERYGLRSIWDNPTFNVSLYYDLNDPNHPNGVGMAGNDSSSSHQTLMMGLWDAGNFYLSKTFDILNNGPSHAGSFSTWSSWLFVHDNGVSVLFSGYLATLDALVELTVTESDSIYQLQLIVLILEGGLFCIVMCAYMWIAAHRYSKKRYDLYSVFLQIPLGVTRGLANMSIKLEANGEEEDSDTDLNPGLLDNAHHQNHQGSGGGGGGNAVVDTEGLLTDGAIKAAALSSERRSPSIYGVAAAAIVAASTAAVGASSAQKRRASFTFGGLGGQKSLRAEDDTNGESNGNGSGKKARGPVPMSSRGITSKLRSLSTAIISLATWRRKSRVSPLPSTAGPATSSHRTKRRLIPSQKLAFRLVSPFIVWGLMIIAVNLVGYFLLKSMSAPIATLNIVNVMIIRFHRVEFYVLEVAAAMSEAIRNVFKVLLSTELSAWIFEYGVMLYGNQAAGNRQDAHFRLATTGVVFSGYTQPAELLYHAGDCLASDPADCQLPNSPYYKLTHNGLDVLLKSLFLQVDSLVHQDVKQSGLNSTEFNFVWSTGQTDAEGGLIDLGEIFLNDVIGSYSQVITQQIVLFCIAWAMALMFLLLQLRPIVLQAQNEMRRVAELLSQLPPEVDCEGMVMAVTLGDQQPTSKEKGTAAAAGGSPPAVFNNNVGPAATASTAAWTAATGGGAGGGSSGSKHGFAMADLTSSAPAVSRRKSALGTFVRADTTASPKDGG